ncbi:DUF1622 domain-containing protein [Microbacterium rhizosphaerae]|uniref:DUF1622 domain-containing protein n=1 Tax=Microbacterium rhizosphaerae TaxID=1678237 RepID=A0ABZ0SN46_9MICO|nr:DUF1622 domain-containing protein [Microbacterium rhizosphaerae]WPR89253.1 DUF1622 domain-containing protein [Microbacterium rhizosphaerae]
MSIEHLFDSLAIVFEIAGAAVLVVGFILALALSIRSVIRREGAVSTFRTVRSTLGGAILLALEVLVAADLIRTLREPTLEEALILGIIVLIRTILSISIQIEIDGILPWRRALLTSGGQVMASGIRDAVRPGANRQA